MPFEEIFEKIRASRSKLAVRKKTFADAQNSSTILESKCDEAKNAINVSMFLDKIEEIKSHMSNHNYSEASRLSSETLTEIDSSLDSWRPNIKVFLPENMIPGKWKKYSLRLTNEGNAHASSIDIQFSEGIRQQGVIQLQSLAATESVELEVNLVTEFAGSVNAKAHTSFSRKYDNKQYSVDLDEWIEIGEKVTPVSKKAAPQVLVTSEYRDTVKDWIKPSDLAPDGETLLDLFTRRWECYSNWPDNVKQLDYLHNNFRDVAISSYFEIPTDPATVLSEWSLPPNLRKNVYLDDERASHILEVLDSKSDDNYVIIGEPGVGKTTLLFEIFDSFMDKVPTGILTTTGITNAHLEFGMRLFYDDIPENTDIVQGIIDGDAKGLVVTAREADWNKLPDEFQRKFKRLTVPLFSDENISRLCERMFDFSNIRHDPTSIEQLTNYAQGSPIFIWLMIKEMHYNGMTVLSKNYVKDNSRKGMENYVSLILQRLLKDGPNYKKGGLHALACMVFLSDYMRDRRCHEALYRSFADEIEEDFEKIFDDRQNTSTFNQTIVYLSGEGTTISFPHDTWADVLQGVGRTNPLRADIQSIKRKFADKTYEDKYKKQAVTDAWETEVTRFNKNMVREKDSFLSLIDTLTYNYPLSALEKLGVDIELMREVSSINSDLPMAARIMSRIQAARPTQVTQIINIQHSVISKSTLEFSKDNVNVESSVITNSELDEEDLKNSKHSIVVDSKKKE
tara:strand:+ start:1181 stop:3388 length:2208 start_codon:yes stop_codon:yes gene_type:complete